MAASVAHLSLAARLLAPSPAAPARTLPAAGLGLAELYWRPPAGRAVPALAPVGRHDGAGGFRRRNCCLIYRAAPGRAGALCEDCGLGRVPGRH